MSGPSSVLRSVWDAIPSTNCKGWCVESCGPIGAGPEETRLLAERGVLLPDLLAVLESVRAGGEPPSCPALVNGRCSVYEVRPTVCFLPNTYVYSSRGPVQISSILAGDRVFGADGQLHRVEATASRWYQGLIAGVRFTGTHVSAWCTVDHQWLCVSQKDKRKRPVPLWKSAADLQPKRHHQVGDYLCFPRTFEDVCDLEKLDVTKFVSGLLSDDDTTLRPFTVGSFPGRIQQELPAFWPGNAESDERASELLALFIATGDSSRCPYCRTQQRITGPLAKVLDADAGMSWRHSDGTECVAGHDADTMQCVEGGGIVNRGGGGGDLMAQAERDVSASESSVDHVLYRVVCLTCGGKPGCKGNNIAYEGTDLKTARWTLRSMTPDGHDIRLQSAQLAWEDVERAGDRRD